MQDLPISAKLERRHSTAAYTGSLSDLRDGRGGARVVLPFDDNLVMPSGTSENRRPQH